jgi:hypothetical protein
LQFEQNKNKHRKDQEFARRFIETFSRKRVNEHLIGGELEWPQKRKLRAKQRRKKKQWIKRLERKRNSLQ